MMKRKNRSVTNSNADVFGVVLWSSNRKERTITIARTFNGKVYVKYRSFELSQSDWDYYTSDATEGDFKTFLRTNNYRVV